MGLGQSMDKILRINILRWTIVGMWFLLSMGLFHLQVLRWQYYYKKSQENFVRMIPLPAPRGDILDRKMRVLAYNTLAFDVAINPQAKDREIAFKVLARLLDISIDKLKKEYKKNYLAPFIPVVIYRDIPKKLALKIEELRFVYPQITVLIRPKRVYPWGEVVSHVLGYVRPIDKQRLRLLKKYGYSRRDEVGYTGVEEEYDPYLKGRPGLVKIAVDSRGRKVELLSEKLPEKGQSLVLTIDKDIQEIVFNHLKGHNGSVIMMDPFSGEVLAMVNWPSYDNNLFLSGSDNQKKTAILKDQSFPLLNRAMAGLYPPGSTFKILMAAAALDSGIININTRFYCPGFVKLGGVRFGCVHIHKDENVIEALAHSCNVFFYNLGVKLGVDNIDLYAERLGVGRKTEIDLPGEKNGLLPGRRWKQQTLHQGWFEGDTLNLSIGQGYLLMTPIQVLMLGAVVANGGFIVRPFVVKYSGDYEVNYTSKKDTGIPREVWKIVENGLESAVSFSDGTAHILSSIDGVRVAGKTGTAQSKPGRPAHGWFVGFFPVERPKYAVVIFLEYGKSSYYACELLKEIIEEMVTKGLV